MRDDNIHAADAVHCHSFVNNPEYSYNFFPINIHTNRNSSSCNGNACRGIKNVVISNLYDGELPQDR